MTGRTGEVTFAPDGAVIFACGGREFDSKPVALRDMDWTYVFD
jgi:hypothetical protein